jgi:GNAT superfamily N-acetyltransferase
MRNKKVRLKTLDCQIKVSTSPSEAAILADAALKARLYVSGWALSYELRRIRDNISNRRVALAYIGDDCVGVCIRIRGLKELQVFVRKKYRRMGIGSELVKALKRKGDQASEGIRSSRKFWEANNISLIR